LEIVTSRERRRRVTWRNRGCQWSTRHRHFPTGSLLDTKP